MKRTREERGKEHQQGSYNTDHETTSDWVNYIICHHTNDGNDASQVYSGVTNNLARRLKQHRTNRGALRTRNWTSLCIVAIIRQSRGSLLRPSKTFALSLERKLKQTLVPGGGVEGRIKAIIKLLQSGFHSKALGRHITGQELRENLFISTSLSRPEILQITSADQEIFKNWVFDSTLNP